MKLLYEERSNEVEAGLQAFIAEMIAIARKYNNKTDNAGKFKESNMTEKQVEGLKEIETKIL